MTAPARPVERIVAAAILHGDLTCSLAAPARHHDIIRAMVKAGLGAPVRGRQGFVTSIGRFVDRNEAAGIAHLAGQIQRLLANLHSEDVW